jgi:hypothetical protein
VVAPLVAWPAALVAWPAAAGLLACVVAGDAAGLVAVLLELLEQAVAPRTIPAAHATVMSQFLMVMLPHGELARAQARPYAFRQESPSGQILVPTDEYASSPASVHGPAAALA